MPTETEMKSLEKICEQPVMELLKRNKDFGKVEFDVLLSKIRNSSYADQDIKDAAHLIDRCLEWVPNKRISASAALSHPFFARR